MPSFNRPNVDNALCLILDNASGQAGKKQTRLPSRIKKLLDLDRALAAEATRGTARAFTDHAGLKQGVDAAYTHFNAFCLALGLELLESGFKQSEVVFWIRLTRSALEMAYAHILQGHLAVTMPEGKPLPLPSKNDRCYMMVENILSENSFPELKPAPTSRISGAKPVAIVPKFFYGTQELAAALDRSPSYLRRWLIIECRTLAVRLHNVLIETSKN
jgi:hypothetical protein